MRDFCGKTLTMARDGYEMNQIPDIGEVAQDNPERQLQTIRDAMIIGVLQLDSYRSCMRCKARVDPITPPLGRCSKSECNMLQRFDMSTLQSSWSGPTMIRILYMLTAKPLKPRIGRSYLLNLAPLASVTYDANTIIKTFEL